MVERFLNWLVRWHLGRVGGVAVDGADLEQVERCYFNGQKQVRRLYGCNR